MKMMQQKKVKEKITVMLIIKIYIWEEDKINKKDNKLVYLSLKNMLSRNYKKYNDYSQIIPMLNLFL